MNLTKFLLASASTFFLVNQQAGAMKSSHEGGDPSAPSTVPVAQQPAGAAAQPSRDLFSGLKECLAKKQQVQPSALSTSHVDQEISPPVMAVTAPASLTKNDGDDDLDVPTPAAASSSPPASIPPLQDPEWTAERMTWLFNAVTQPIQTMPKLQSRTHPLTELQAMGIHEDEADPTRRRFNIAAKYFNKITLSQLTDLQSNSRLLAPKCPVETLVAYLQALSEKEIYSVVKKFLEKRKTLLGSLPPELEYYLGAFYNQMTDALAGEPHYSRFLNWYKIYGTSGVGRLFTDKHRADAHTLVGLAFERIPAKINDVYDHHLAAFGLSEDFTTASNLARWTSTRKMPGSELYKQRALELQNKGRGGNPVRVVMHSLVSPRGDVLPVGVGVRGSAYDAGLEKAMVDSKFNEQGRLLYARFFKNHSPEEFRALPNHLDVFQADVHLLTQPDVVKPEDVAATLQRIRERLPIVDLNLQTIGQLAKLWPLFSRTEHGRTIFSIQEILRRVITDLAKQKSNLAAIFSYVSALPGLTEEVAFTYLQCQGGSTTRPATGTFGNQVIQMNSLHMELHKTQPLPHNVLQILERASISPESDLYAYWKKQWDDRYGVEELRRYKEFFAELERLHDAYLTQKPPRLTAGKGGRTGARVAPGDDDDISQVSQPESYDPTGTINEAWRRASDQTYAIPNDVTPFLDLRVTPSVSGGSESKATLFETNPDKTETELASFRPHRTHARYYDADELKMMTMLWNLHCLQTTPQAASSGRSGS